MAKAKKRYIEITLNCGKKRKMGEGMARLYIKAGKGTVVEEQKKKAVAKKVNVDAAEEKREKVLDADIQAGAGVDETINLDDI